MIEFTVTTSRSRFREIGTWLFENIGPLYRVEPSGEVIGLGWSLQKVGGRCRIRLLEGTVNEEIVTLFLLRWS